MAKPVRFKRWEYASFKVRTSGRQEFLWEDLYYSLLTHSWLGFFAWVVLFYITVNIVFAGLYMIQPGCIANARVGSLVDHFFFSIQTMATIGYGVMAPTTLYAHALVSIEALIGILCVALLTGMTFAKFARPTSRILFAERGVVGPRYGESYLYFRFANWRHNAITDLKISLTLLINEETPEGESIRIPTPLFVEDSEVAVFFLSWFVEHRIDEKSPFYGIQFPEQRQAVLENLRKKNPEIMLVVTGTDEILGQSVTARRLYQLDDICVQARYADILSILPSGERALDYSKFNEIEFLK